LFKTGYDENFSAIVSSNNPLSGKHANLIKQQAITYNTAMTTNIEVISKYVEYHEKHGVLRCISHKYGMTRDGGVHRHLQSHHQSIPIGIRNKIVQYADDLELKDPKDVRPPNPDAGPIEGFEIIENGFKCTFEGCPGYYGATENTMKDHCKKMHKSNEKKWVRQAVQTFFPCTSFIYYSNISAEYQLLPCDHASNYPSDCNGCIG
jgi:Orsellinic acid/F9775 biosynthesis cluster protein D